MSVQQIAPFGTGAVVLPSTLTATGIISDSYTSQNAGGTMQIGTDANTSIINVGGTNGTAAVNLLTTAAGAISIGNNAATTTIGSSGIATSTVNINTGSGGAPTNIGTGTGGAVSIGNATGTLTLASPLTTTQVIGAGWSGPGALTGSTVNFMKIGQLVIAKFPAVTPGSASSASSATWAGTVPAGFRPPGGSTWSSYSLVVTNNSQGALGVIEISNTGGVTVFVSGTNNLPSSFTGSGNYSPMALDQVFMWSTV